MKTSPNRRAIYHYAEQFPELLMVNEVYIKTTPPSCFEVRGAAERDGRLRAPAHDARKRAVHEERDGREAEEDGRGVAAEAQAEVRSAVDGVAAAPHPTRW